jgi:hypothetical protein
VHGKLHRETHLVGDREACVLSQSSVMKAALEDRASRKLSVFFFLFAIYCLLVTIIPTVFTLAIITLIYLLSRVIRLTRISRDINIIRLLGLPPPRCDRTFASRPDVFVYAYVCVCVCVCVCVYVCE